MNQTLETKLNLYKAVPRVTGTTWILIASCQAEAEKQLGDSANQFNIMQVKVRRHGSEEKGYHDWVLVPAKTCPYQYGECRRPPEGECRVKGGAPDMTEWIRRATEAHLCQWTGVTLSKTNHALCQKWIRKEDAILEFARK